MCVCGLLFPEALCIKKEGKFRYTRVRSGSLLLLLQFTYVPCPAAVGFFAFSAECGVGGDEDGDGGGKRRRSPLSRLLPGYAEPDRCSGSLLPM